MDVAILVVNSIAALCAVIAAIIAIVVYNKTAKLQRKAIGYSIIDDRLKVWKYMEHDRNQSEATIRRILEGRDWEIEKFRLLFSDKLVKEYDEFKACCKECEDLGETVRLLEREGLPIARTGETVNSDDYDRYGKVYHEREMLQNAGGSSSSLNAVAFKTLCQDSFPADKWETYYKNVLALLDKESEQKERLSVFLQHMHKEIADSL